MRKIDRRLIDGELLPIDPGTVGQVLMVMSDGTHEFDNLLPDNPPEPAQVLVGQSGGTFVWFGNAVVVIPAGGSVPPGTPAGTVVVQEAE